MSINKAVTRVMGEKVWLVKLLITKIMCISKFRIECEEIGLIVDLGTGSQLLLGYNGSRL